MHEDVAPTDPTRTIVAVVVATTGTTTMGMGMGPATSTTRTSIPTLGAPGRGEWAVDSRHSNIADATQVWFWNFFSSLPRCCLRLAVLNTSYILFIALLVRIGRTLPRGNIYSRSLTARRML